MLTSGMVGGSYKFSDLLKKKKRTKKKKKKEKSDKRSSKGEPSKLGYHAKRTNLNIIMKGSDGNLYKNKKYKKTKKWVKVRSNKKKKK